jgi:[ribosomal protein S5]-alanine N-acetyltransferase
MPSLPEFRTPRLLLRELTPSDAPSYTKHFVDYEVIRHLSAVVPWPYPENGVRDFIERQVVPYQGRDKWVWAITLADNRDEVIGAVDLWRVPRPENRGFWLGRAFWGNGYMTEAVAPVTDYAFDVLGFERLIVSNAVGNRRSGRVNEKSGAVLIGRAPAAFVDPALTEHEIWELTRERWREFGKKNVVTVAERFR